jgi:hypothetical protein
VCTVEERLNVHKPCDNARACVLEDKFYFPHKHPANAYNGILYRDAQDDTSRKDMTYLAYIWQNGQGFLSSKGLKGSASYNNASSELWILEPELLSKNSLISSQIRSTIFVWCGSYYSEEIVLKYNSPAIAIGRSW